MIRNLSILIIAALFISFHTPANSQTNKVVIDEIIWVVGEQAILKSDVEEYKIYMKSQGETIEGDPYCFIPEQLAVQKLFLDQAALDSVVVSDSHVNIEVAEQEKNYINLIGSKEKLEEYLNAPIIEIRERWREDARNNSLVMTARRSISNKAKALTPSDVRRFYEQLSKDSLPYIPSTVEVQIITKKPLIPLSEVDEIKERLRDFRERVLTGKASFSSLAIMYSQDGSASSGGELGFSGRAAYLPEFSNVAFALTDPEKVSNIVETEYGFHIIQLIERRGDRANFRHIILRPDIPEEEFNKSKIALDSLGRDINLGKFSFEDGSILSDDKDTRKNGGLMINMSRRGSYGLSPRFPMEDLPVEIASVVDTMEVGQISRAFKLQNPSSGQETVAIVKLKKRVDGHIANVSDDYQVLKDLVEARRQEDELNKWLEKKIDDTYIKINRNWRNCKFKYPGWLKENN